MSASAPGKPQEVRIDRLVLDIPGLDPARAQGLASGIAERLAQTGLTGEHASIGITLGPVGIGEAELTARIVAALMERLA